MLEFHFDFRSRRHGGKVGRAVEQVWYARGTVPYRSELIAPTGSSVVLLILGAPIRETAGYGRSVTSDEGIVIGPHIEPVENAPLGETFALGIVTTSSGTEATLGVRPATLRGRVEGPDQVGRGLSELRGRLAAVSDADPEHLLDLAVGHVAETTDLGVPGIGRVEQAVAILEEEPRTPITDIARRLGVSHAHLDREFGRVVGLPPRALARLLLLRRLLAALDPGQDISWAEVAFENGWSDQAHFSRDFKRHTGVTPRQYVETQRAVISGAGVDAAGFTPDLGDLR